MSIDTKDHSWSCPNTILFGNDKLAIHKPSKVPNFLTLTFNPAKVVNGHNLHLLSPQDDVEIFKGVTDHLADLFGSERFVTLGNWNLNYLELSENRIDEDPQAFVYRLSKIAHDQKEASMFVRHGTHTVTFGPKTQQLKVYAKGPQFKKLNGRAFPDLIEEANQYIRFERISNAAGTEKLLGRRSLPALVDFLGSYKAKNVLQLCWSQLPRVESPELSTLVDGLLLNHSLAQTRSLLGFDALKREIGETAAAAKLGLARATVNNYRNNLQSARNHIADGEVI